MAIVVVGDSRTTLTLPPVPGGNVQTNVVSSDAAEKTFVLYDKFAVATCGAAFIGGLPVAHYIAQFALNNPAPNSVVDLGTGLKTFFRNFNPIPAIIFLVTGYDAGTPSVYAVTVATDTMTRANLNANGVDVTYGVYYAGDISVVQRLLSQPEFMPQFGAMNVQDAIDFSRHLIRSTIDQLRFEPRFPTVGGDIDTIVVTSTETKWLQKKSLACR